VPPLVQLIDLIYQRQFDANSAARTSLSETTSIVANRRPISEREPQRFGEDE
jgi:hypothetical protein